MKPIIFLVFSIFFMRDALARDCLWKAPVFYAEYQNGNFIQGFKVVQRVHRGNCSSAPQVIELTSDVQKEFDVVAKHFKINLASGTYIFTNRCRSTLEEECLRSSKIELAQESNSNFEKLKAEWRDKEEESRIDDLLFNIGFPFFTIIFIMLPVIFAFTSKESFPFQRHIIRSFKFQLAFLFLLFLCSFDYLWSNSLRNQILTVCSRSLLAVIIGEIIYDSFLRLRSRKLSR